MNIEQIKHWIVLKRQFIALGATDSTINTDVAEKMMLLNQLMEFIEMRERETIAPRTTRFGKAIRGYFSRVRLFFVKKQIESHIIQSIEEYNKKSIYSNLHEGNFKDGYDLGYANAIRMILQFNL
jgi:hypothetical protein